MIKFLHVAFIWGGQKVDWRIAKILCSRKHNYGGPSIWGGGAWGKGQRTTRTPLTMCTLTMCTLEYQLAYCHLIGNPDA